MANKTSQPNKFQVKYEVVRTDTGFKVIYRKHHELDIIFEGSCWRIGEKRLSAHDLYTLIKELTAYFVAIYAQDGTNVTYWLEQNTGSAINAKVYPVWLAILAANPSEALLLDKKMFSTVFGNAPLLHTPELYNPEFEHLRKDLIRYNACRYFIYTEPFELPNTMTETEHVAILKRMANWRVELAPEGKPNAVFNKTIDAVPRGISPRLIRNSPRTRLTQPATDKLSLTFLLLATQHRHWETHHEKFRDLSPAAICAAADAVGNPLTKRDCMKTENISIVLTLILDCPEPGHDRLLGLARRSRAWHEQLAQQNRQPMEYGTANSTLPEPQNIDLVALEQAGCRLIRTVHECWEEGALMKHCVGIYAKGALRGKCFLFHVDYASKQATVEIDETGQVVQAYGPANKNNVAADYGRQVLQRAFAEYRRRGTIK